MTVNVENVDLKEIVDSTDSELKNLIVQYVGEQINPENDEVTVENVVEVFSNEFPEFLLVVAEENWVSGYTQALNDVDFVTQSKTKETNEDLISTKTEDEL